MDLLPQIPIGIEAWWYYLCVGSAVLIIGVAKGGFGGGIGVLAIPVMAAVMPSQVMLGMLLPVLICADILSNLHYLKEYNWPILKWLVIGALAGVAIGTAILLGIDGMAPVELDRTMKYIIGGVCVAVVLAQVYRLFGKELPTLPKHPASGASIGALAGGVSTLTHSAGPIVSIYLLQEKLPKRKLMGTMLLYFLLINTAKVPTFVYFGWINKQTLHDSIWFLPLLPIGTVAGAWLNKRVDEKPFAAIMYIAAAYAAVNMIYKASTM